MSEYTAKVSWRIGAGEDFINSQYSRGHEWSFDGGVSVLATRGAAALLGRSQRRP